MNLRNPLARAHGLGSAKTGVSHWWWQRLTALALVPLSLWFVTSLVCMVGAEHAIVVEWLKSPDVTLLMVLFIVVLFHHTQLGVQVVIEDYIHIGWQKLAALVLVKFLAVLAAAAAILAVLTVSLGLWL